MDDALVGPLVDIAGGYFLMGSSVEDAVAERAMFAYAFDAFDPGEVDRWFLKQVPAHRVVVRPFRIARYPVTNRQFAHFEHAVPDQPKIARADRPEHPVTPVSLEQSQAYCAWLGRSLAPRRFRLPSEAEWEFVATAGGRRRFPWGDDLIAGRANCREFGPGTTTTVGAFPNGASIDGVHDLAGNVEEWTATAYAPYLGGVLIEDDLSRSHGGPYHVMRGGSFKLFGDLCLSRRRHGYHRDYTIPGFRIAEDL